MSQQNQNEEEGSGAAWSEKFVDAAHKLYNRYANRPGCIHMCAHRFSFIAFIDTSVEDTLPYEYKGFPIIKYDLRQLRINASETITQFKDSGVDLEAEHNARMLAMLNEAVAICDGVLDDR